MTSSQPRLFKLADTTNLSKSLLYRIPIDASSSAIEASMSVTNSVCHSFSYPCPVQSTGILVDIGAEAHLRLLPSIHHSGFLPILYIQFPILYTVFTFFLYEYMMHPSIRCLSARASGHWSLIGFDGTRSACSHFLPVDGSGATSCSDGAPDCGKHGPFSTVNGSQRWKNTAWCDNYHVAEIGTL